MSTLEDITPSFAELEEEITLLELEPDKYNRIFGILSQLKKEILRLDKKTFPTYNEDADVESLAKMDDRTLRSACTANKYLANLCNKDYFWRQRIIDKYGVDLTDYLNGESYKTVYRRLMTGTEEDLIYTAAKYEYVPILQHDALLITENPILEARPSKKPGELIIAAIISQNEDAIDFSLDSPIIRGFKDMISAKRLAYIIGKYGVCETADIITTNIFPRVEDEFDDAYLQEIYNELINSVRIYSNWTFLECLSEYISYIDESFILESLKITKRDYSDDLKIMNAIAKIYSKVILLTYDQRDDIAYKKRYDSFLSYLGGEYEPDEDCYFIQSVLRFVKDGNSEAYESVRKKLRADGNSCI